RAMSSIPATMPPIRSPARAATGRGSRLPSTVGAAPWPGRSRASSALKRIALSPSTAGSLESRPFSFAAVCLVHVVEDGSARPAIEFQTARLLIAADRGAGQHPGLAVDLVAVNPQRGEPALHLLDVAAA